MIALRRAWPHLAAAALLAPEMGADEDELASDLDGLRRFVWIKRKTTDEEAKRVLAENLRPKKSLQ